MINSFLNTTKTIENNTKNCYSNFICRRERRLNNGKNNAHILRNVRHKNEYNNHRFYMGNEKDDSKNTNLSEMYSKIHRWDLYKSNSKPKKEENEIRLNFKTNNHNYHNINTAYHSFEKKEKIYERNTYDNKNSNNIKLIENEVYTPRLNNKSKNIVYQQNCNDLSKTMNNFKNRDNYGYHEIKDVKKNNKVNKNSNINSNNNKNNNIKTERKNDKKSIPNYLSINISNNNSFRRSLNINNNTGTSNNINNNNNNNTNNTKNYNSKNNIPKNELNTNNIVNDANKNSNQRKNSYLNFKTAQNYFNPPKNIITEESNNYSSYKNIIEPKKNIKNEKQKNETNNNIKNLNKSLLIRKIYIKSTPEDKRPKNCNGSRVNIIKRNNLMNTNIFFNNKENDKNMINSNRFLSGEFKDVVKDGKKERIINRITNTEKKISNSKIPNNKISKINKINKMYSPIKKENSKINNHLKQNSYLNYNTNSTEKKNSKLNEKYEINHIFKKVEKINLNKITTRKNKNEKANEIKIPNAHRINEKTLKVNSKEKTNNSIILQTNDSLRRLKEKATQKINISKEKDEIQKTNTNNRKANINTNTYIKKCIKNYEGKENKINKSNNNKNYLKPKQKNEIVNNNSQSKPNNKYNNNPFNREDNTKKKELKDEKNKNSYKFLIKKKCKSIEKNDNKNNEEPPIAKAKKKLRSRTKTKSKAKKHSDKVKHLDKLKIFKYSETNYNIYYESSTNCSKDNYDYRYKKLALKSTKSHSKKKKNINSFNLNYKTFEEDFKINKDNINEKYQNLKPQISVRITLSKQNNVNIAGILRYFKVIYFCSENLRNKYDYDSEDTSEFYNAKF